MSMTTPIVDFVRRYAQSGTVRLHMPGHKGQPLLGFEPWDITEIQGADELYEAEGIIARSEANATQLFGTRHTYYSTEGSSQCIRAMLWLAMQGAAPAQHRPVLLAARNAHKALLYAAALLDFDIEWLWPAPQAQGALCSCPVSAQQLADALARLAEQGRSPFGVYVTSPDYLGGVQDIAALSAVCAEQGVPLLVDNAHGAYLHFLPEGSRHPIRLGAAMCCDSGHKTLPVVTGGAYLHLGPRAPVQSETAVRNALALFGSTSPSYLILQSLDACNRMLDGEYPRQVAECCRRLEVLRSRLNAASAAAGCILPLARSGPDQEPMKLTLDASALGISGQALAQTLRQAGIECEYADPRYLVLMPTPLNPPQDLQKLEAVLLELCAADRAPVSAGLADEAEAFRALAQQAVCRCTVRQAVLAAQETLPAHEALGRVCAMPTVSCPPAIPIVVSGEEIGPAALELLERYGVTAVSVLR